MMLPKDPYILMSVINTRLRDGGITLEELCKAEDANMDEILSVMKSIGFTYDKDSNSLKK